MKTKYKYNCLIVAFLLCTNILSAQDNVVISAIKSEVDRNKSGLKIDKLKPPFFISYSIIDRKTLNIAATLGALSQSAENSQRIGMSNLLVGDYDRNNSNYRQNPYPYRQIVCLEDDPRGIATDIWTDLDKVYKTAAENYESKVATIAQQNLEEEEVNLPDMEKTNPVTVILEPVKPNMDKAYWENYAKKSSELLKKYPEIVRSNVEVNIMNHVVYTYNTEGTKLVVPSSYYGLRLNIYTITEDGQELTEDMYIEHQSFEQMPSLQTYLDTCRNFVEFFIKLQNAPIITEAYIGPVLFEGMAVAEALKSNFFQSTLLASRKPIGDQGGNNTEMMKDKKLISRSLTIKSLSGTETYKNEKLDGYYAIDNEGVAPDKELALVENGVLRNMLNGRTPTKKFRHSNGHLQMGFNTMTPRIMPGNVLLSSNNACSPGELKKKLLAAAKEEDLDYAYIIRRYRGNNSLAIYKIYVADGREELLRGAVLSDFNIKSYKRVLGASNQELIYNSYSSGRFATYIVPNALLFEELEVTRNSNITFKKPFIVPQPKE
jgi:hypothetical protein